MSFIATIAPDAADGETAEMYRRQQASWGFVPNYAKVFSHRPEIMARWGQLLAEIKRPMDPRRFELVTFVAAHALGNTACTLAHGKALRRSSATRRSWRSPQAASTACSAPPSRRCCASPARWRSTPRGDRRTTSRRSPRTASPMPRSSTSPPPPPAAPSSPRCSTRSASRPTRRWARSTPPLRRALTVGRPIDERPPATMPAAPPLRAALEGDRHAA